MNTVARLSHVLATAIVLSLFGKAFGPRGDEPNIHAVAKQKVQLSDLQFVRPPVNEQRVNAFLTSARLQLKIAKSPDSLPQRDAYVKELVRLLQRFAMKDVLKENLSPADDRTLWLSDRTVGRVIRLLGDLNAVEAVDTISEYLLLAPDVESLRLTIGEDLPTHWVLFEIGDASLPILRKKMTSDGSKARSAAAHSAARILGPRAEKEMEKWIAAAESEEQRERLEGARRIFQLYARKNQTPEEYRQQRLEEGRRSLENLLERPFIMDMEQETLRLELVKPASGY